MKVTSLLLVFCAGSLLTPESHGASLSLGPGGLTSMHPAGGSPNSTLQYVDPSGIVIVYTKPSQANFTGDKGLNSRGWSHDADADVLGFVEIKAQRPDHLAIAHFNGADQVNISFASASNIDLSTVKLHIWDLDTNIGSNFTEAMNIIDSSGVTFLTGAGVAQDGSFEIVHPLSIGSPNQLVQLKLNSNPRRDFGLSAFTLSWDAVPEPSTGLLALLGGSFLFLGRRRPA